MFYSCKWHWCRSVSHFLEPRQVYCRLSIGTHHLSLLQQKGNLIGTQTKYGKCIEWWFGTTVTILKNEIQYISCNLNSSNRTHFFFFFVSGMRTPGNKSTSSQVGTSLPDRKGHLIPHWLAPCAKCGFTQQRRCSPNKTKHITLKEKRII